MSKKILRMIFAIIFFFINIKVTAAEYDLCPSGHDCWVGYQCLENTTGWETKGFTYYTLGINEKRSLNGLCPTLVTKTKGSTTTYEHVYCLEPGVSLKDTRKAFKITDSNKVVLNKYLNEAKEYSRIKELTEEQKTRIVQILTFALRIDDPQINKARKSLGQVVGAQGLLWEVVTGERKNFDSYVPDGKVKSSFYDMITNKTNQSKSQYLVYAESDYKRIIDKIKGTFDAVLGESGTNKIFKTASAANLIPMTWNGSKFVLEITDVDFQHWSIVSSSLPSGVTAKKVDNKVIIESVNPIPEDAAVSIEMEITRESWKTTPTGGDAYAGNPTVLFAKNNQDVITVIGTTQQRFIKVYTPQYGVEIVKTATIEGVKSNLNGAEFKIYDTNGTTVLDSGKTDENGELTFIVNKPGTYKIEETTAPAGFKQKSGNAKYSYVTVTEQNKIDKGNFATIEVENESKSVNLIKYTVDETGRKTKLDDGCTEEGAAVFSIKNNGKELYFKPINGIQGKYVLSSKDESDADNKVLTCNGEFVVYNLTDCEYTITETKAPQGMTIPSELKKNVNVCSSNGEVTFTNGFAGVEFQKKKEDGSLLAGGSFALQKKESGLYKDVLLRKNSDGVYEYDEKLTTPSEDVDYIFHTLEGNALIRKIAPGDYRIVEKEAPEGYEPIEDKDSTAIFTIKTGEQESHYLVELINQRVNTSGSDATAELVVTITTGRSRINYLVVIPSLLVLLILIVVIRKKLKK